MVLTDPAGDHPRTLPVDGGEAAWSPDGSRVAYATHASDATAELRIYDVEREQRRRLGSYGSAGNGYTGTPEIQWSPDGRWIGVTEWQRMPVGQDESFYEPEVRLFDAATGDQVDAGPGVLLAWSPDSSRLLVRRLEERIDWPSPARGRVVIVDIADGSALTLGRGVNASWSADCRFVSVDQGWQTPGTTVYDGVARRPRLAAATAGSDWSSAGAELALSVGGRLIRWSTDEAEPRVIGKGSAPLWSEDATQLAFITKAGLSVADGDGQNVRIVATPDYPLGDLSWSPDGRFLISSHEWIPDTCGGPEWGFMIATDGSGVRELPTPYHIRWRPTDPTPAEGAVDADSPPVRGEGCGG